MQCGLNIETAYIAKAKLMPSRGSWTDWWRRSIIYAIKYSHIGNCKGTGVPNSSGVSGKTSYSVDTEGKLEG